MLQSAPPYSKEFVALGFLSCFLFGKYCGQTSVWLKWFPAAKGSFTVYAKQGEYGEYDQPRSTSWLSGSPFQEPYNAWTSLIYSVFGIVMICIASYDYYTNQSMGEPQGNRISSYPEFSLMYGLSCFWLGISSFLFHASHAEVWRKADAGMTSGVVVAIVAYGLWDRVRPPGTSSSGMVLLALIVQFSFTHGFLPYGSSDILLPSLVAVTFGLELLPRYGGVVDSEQYILWYETLFAVSAGMLLRLADVKRKNTSFFNNALRILAALTVFPFGYLLGILDPVVIFAIIGIITVKLDPSRGHIFWHFGSAYALYNWWYMFRVRPSDPAEFTHSDATIITILVLIIVKNAVRRLFMVAPLPSQDHKDRWSYLLEHVVFAAWAYYSIVIVPEAQSAGSSWLLNPALCWVKPSYPSDFFQLFYLAKTATHSEDLIYIAYNRYKESKAKKNVESQDIGDYELVNTLESNNLNNDDSQTKMNNAPNPTPKDQNKDTKMDIHHIATAILCLASAFTGYSRIGSLIMFLHDLSDIPLDLVRIFGLFDMKNAQAGMMFVTLGTWLYWRLYWFPVVVLYSIAVDSKSLLKEDSCEIGHCSLSSIPERIPFLILLGILVILHYFWFGSMVKKFVVALKSDI